MISLNRPRPPAELLELTPVAFVPAHDLMTWTYATFIDEGGALENPEHVHLRDARIGMLWTNCANTRQQRSIVGQAELCQNAGGFGKWPRGRAEQQLGEWFEETPDFLITIFAPYAAECNDATFCAVIEHELSHCGQEVDAYGMRKFRSSGTPAFAMRGHDVEEFVGVVARYGADATGVRALVDAANAGPSIGFADISFACGSCKRLASSPLAITYQGDSNASVA